MPVTRLSVGGVSLALRSRRVHPALQLPDNLRAFTGARGEHIRLELREEPVPAFARSPLLFDSGGLWRAYRHGSGLLYTFRAPAGPATTRAVAVDRAWRRGRLYLPGSADSTRPGFAFFYPLDELAFQHHLAWNGGLVVHASGVLVGGKAALFCGKSGAGKTTLARLFHRRDVPVLSDDRVVLRGERGRVHAYGTPWSGEGGLASPQGRPVAALFFLEHGRTTSVAPLAQPLAAATLFARSFFPLWEAEAIARVLDSSIRFVRGIPCYRLRFRPDASAVAAVHKALSAEPRRRAAADAGR